MTLGPESNWHSGWRCPIAPREKCRPPTLTLRQRSEQCPDHLHGQCFGECPTQVAASVRGVDLIQADHNCRVQLAILSSSAPGIYSCRRLFLLGRCGLMVSASCFAVVSASSAAVPSSSSDSVNNLGFSILQQFPSSWPLGVQMPIM